MDPLSSHNNTNSLREHSYPRVLIVYHCCINKADQHGVSIRGWFGDWPKERLAQIYSGGESGSERFCGQNFRLGPNERRWGKFFFGMKNSDLGQASQHVVNYGEGESCEGFLTLSVRIKRTLGKFLLNSGLWELLFRPILSKELKQWVQEFRPEIIYCQGYTLGFTWLPLMLRKEYALPICFQTGDDWPMTGYSYSALRFMMSHLVRLSASRLIHASVVRLSNGEAMAEVYLKRYKVAFEPIMMCDDYSRFAVSSPRRVVDGRKISVVYAGALGLMRCAPLVDLCVVAQELKSEGLDITVTALATGIAPEALDLLENTPNLVVRPAPPHEELPSYLKGADVLFLHETFDERRAQNIRLSISTKAHLYMMSERPVLIYGHRITGIMDYARQIGWGCRVDQPDRATLKDALRRLLTDESYCHELVVKGIELALRRHDANIIRKKFSRLLFDATRKRGGSNDEDIGR